MHNGDSTLTRKKQWCCNVVETCGGNMWWKLNSVKYSNLSRMARDYLAIPWTSASSERLFSSGKELITNKRNLFSLLRFRPVNVWNLGFNQIYQISESKSINDRKNYKLNIITIWFAFVGYIFDLPQIYLTRCGTLGLNIPIISYY